MIASASPCASAASVLRTITGRIIPQLTGERSSSLVSKAVALDGACGTSLAKKGFAGSEPEADLAKGGKEDPGGRVVIDQGAAQGANSFHALLGGIGCLHHGKWIERLAFGELDLFAHEQAVIGGFHVKPPAWKETAERVERCTATGTVYGAEVVAQALTPSHFDGGHAGGALEFQGARKVWQE